MYLFKVSSGTYSEVWVRDDFRVGRVDVRPLKEEDGLVSAVHSVDGDGT